MGTRRKAREAALQVLFQTEFNDTSFEVILSQFWKNKKADKETREFSRVLVENVLAHKDEIDRSIQSVSEHWRISRMAVIDRCILRIAVCEFAFGEDIAPAIVINEAIEIAKKYSGTEAANFINGILDAIKKNREKDKSAPKGERND
jgi:N utilization substance protein B